MRDACLPNGDLLFPSCLAQKPSLAKKKIVHWTSYDLHKRANAAFLMGTYLLIYHEKSPEEAAKLVQHGPAFVTFRLALHVLACRLWLKWYSTSYPTQLIIFLIKSVMWLLCLLYCYRDASQQCQTYQLTLGHCFSAVSKVGKMTCVHMLP